MCAMYRFKIAASITALVFFILALAIFSYWGAERLDYYYKRSLSSYETEANFRQLAIYTDRYFNDQLDEILLGGEIVLRETQQREQDLNQALAVVRKSVADEVKLTDGDEQSDELGELEIAGELESLILKGMKMTEQARALLIEGRKDEARALSQQILDQLLEREFWPLIDQAIQGEREELHESKAKEEKVFAGILKTTTIVSFISIVLGLIVSFILYRNLQKPLQTLIHGTKKVATGDLSYRIQLEGKDEFSQLAKKFNDMASSLEQQQKALIEGRSILAKEVDIRTEELQKANDRLRKLDSTRKRFFADISHELRTPITIIRGEAEVTLRRKERKDEEYQSALKHIIKLCEQLESLVEDLLYLTRSETWGIRCDSEDIVLNELINECRKDANHLIGTRHLDFHVDTPPDQLVVQGDKKRLLQLLHILISNACHYSHDGDTINLSLERQNAHALICIKDTGQGIDETELDMIFERFYRTEKARLANHTGTGLGLPIAKSITDAHQGSINIQSKINEGTSVCITLPLSTSNTRKTP